MSEPIAGVGYLAGLCGYTGTAWQKQHLLWGYYDVISEALEDKELDAGVNILPSSTVPAGEIWVVQAVSSYFLSATIDYLSLAASVNGVIVPIIDSHTPATDTWYFWSGCVTLKKDDFLRAYVETATALDDLFFRYCGYKMRLDL